MGRPIEHGVVSGNAFSLHEQFAARVAARPRRFDESDVRDLGLITALAALIALPFVALGAAAPASLTVSLAAVAVVLAGLAGWFTRRDQGKVLLAWSLVGDSSRCATASLARPRLPLVGRHRIGVARRPASLPNRPSSR
jgi:hypothetical protein